MLSFWSWQKISMTLCASRPNALQRLPISLAKPIFSACQQLSTYLTISAVSKSVRINGASILSVECGQHVATGLVHLPDDGLGR